MKKIVILLLIFCLCAAFLCSCACKTCKGSGEIDCKVCKNNYCTSCEGSGKCSLCKGTGRYKGTVTCLDCDGKGYFYNAYSGLIDCKTCTSGVLIVYKNCSTITCEKCSGSGIRSSDDDYHYECHNTGKITCWRCEGSGEQS